jgi:DNA-binding response OmpR family regulator
VKILIVEDEEATANFLRKGLSEEGFAVDVATDADRAEIAVALNEYDLILLDVMLPVRDGFSLCRQWRESGLTVPILFLTARDAIQDRVHGLELGGDDYLIKPFAFEELLARIRSLLRRRTSPMQPAQLRFGDVVIDTNRRRVQRGERVIPLTAREYQLLEYLAYHPDRIITRIALWDHVWETGAEPDSNVIDVYVRYLRNKLGRDLDLIETVRGAGYILKSAPYEKD